jgi:hypothetical protein
VSVPIKISQGHHKSSAASLTTVGRFFFHLMAHVQNDVLVASLLVPSSINAQTTMGPVAFVMRLSTSGDHPKLNVIQFQYPTFA